MKILFVTPTKPWPPTTGTNQRTHLLLKALSNCGDVDIALTQNEVEVTQTDLPPERVHWIGQGLAAGDVFPWRTLAALSSRWANRVAATIGAPISLYRRDPILAAGVADLVSSHGFDVIVGRYGTTSVRAGLLDYTPVVVDVDDLVSNSFSNRAASPGSGALKKPILRALGHRLRAVERRRFGGAALWTASEYDQTALDLPNTRVLPNIPFSPAEQPFPPSSSTTILAVATLSYGPNANGIEWFVRDVWPSIRTSVPEAAFRIVGKGMNDQQRLRWAAVDGVEPVGYVDDLADEYRQCAFTVAPVFEGAGTKIKVLESLAFGRACLTTLHAYEGFRGHLRDRESLLVADERGFPSAALELLTDAGFRDKIADRGFATIASRYTYDAFSAIVEETITEVTRAGTLGGVRPAPPSR